MPGKQLRQQPQAVEVGRDCGSNHQRFLSSSERARAGEISRGRNQPSGKEVGYGTHLSVQRIIDSPLSARAVSKRGTKVCPLLAVMQPESQTFFPQTLAAVPPRLSRKFQSSVFMDNYSLNTFVLR